MKLYFDRQVQLSNHEVLFFFRWLLFPLKLSFVYFCIKFNWFFRTDLKGWYLPLPWFCPSWMLCPHSNHHLFASNICEEKYFFSQSGDPKQLDYLQFATYLALSYKCEILSFLTSPLSSFLRGISQPTFLVN